MSWEIGMDIGAKYIYHDQQVLVIGGLLLFQKHYSKANTNVDLNATANCRF